MIRQFIQFFRFCMFPPFIPTCFAFMVFVGETLLPWLVAMPAFRCNTL